MTESRGERLPPEERLRRRSEYLECYRQGRRLGGPMATLFVRPNEVGVPRLGLTASRKLGSAVVRNRLRRRCREIYRRWPERRRLPAVDIVVNLRHPAAKATFTALRESLERQLARLLPPGGLS